MISTSCSHQARGISYGSTSVKGTVILFGRTTNPTTTSYITPQIMSLKKRDREVREPHITLIQISLIYKSCLLYYNKWFIAHASFLKGEAYFRLRISRIFAMFVKSNCPVNNKTKKNYNKLNHTPNLIGSYFQSIWGQRHRLHHHEQHFTSL